MNPTARFRGWLSPSCPRSQGGDVLCGSKGIGFVLTTDYTRASVRKAWIDLKNAVQVNNIPLVPGRSLPRGLVEIELLANTPTNPDGTCIPGAVADPLHMKTGEYYYSAMAVQIMDLNQVLRFGQYQCAGEPSPCPVRVTAGTDFDGDGFADEWMIEPTGDAIAILFKAGKPGSSLPGSKIGSFKVPFTLVFTKA